MATDTHALPYRRDIDGLRSLAVLPVVIFHAGATWMSGGFVGVDIFFVISGYLISAIILREVQGGSFSFLRFYERRLRRIIPALVAVLIVTVAVFQVIALPDQAKGAAESGIAALLSVSNFYFWQQSGYFAPTVELMPLLHTWSLAVEEQFYLLFPIFLIGLWRLKISIKATLVIGTVLAFAIGTYLSYTRPSFAYYLLPARAWELAIGAVLASGAIPAIRSTILREIATILGIAMIVFSVLWIDSSMAFPGWVALIPCIGAGLVIHAGGTSWTARHILGSGLLVFIGLISYSLYLWHWPVLASFRILAVNIHLSPLAATAAVALTFVLATLSWRFVERPFRDRRRMTARPMIATLGTASLVVLGLSVLSIQRDGFPARLPDTARIALEAANDIDPFRVPCRGRADRDGCIFGAPDEPIRTVVVGDSHAAAIRSAAEAAGLFGDGGATMLWEGACALLDGAKWVNHEEGPRCEAFKPYAWETIEQLPDLETVIIGGRWPSYLTGFLPESGGAFRNFLVDGQSGSPSVAENEAAFTRSFQRTLDRLEALGLKVIILGSMPEAGFDVPHSVALALYRGLDEPHGPTRASVEARAGYADNLLADIASGREGVTFISFWEDLCGPDWCRIEEDGAPIYFDDSHLSYHGATTVAAGAISRRYQDLTN